MLDRFACAGRAQPMFLRAATSGHFTGNPSEFLAMGHMCHVKLGAAAASTFKINKESVAHAFLNLT